MKMNSTTSNGDKSMMVVGIMSGTSLDGLDIAVCAFKKHNENWHYEILATKTIRYNQYWQDALSKAHNLPAKELVCLDRNYGNYIGEQIQKFISSKGFQPQLISSHGHTVFHRPEKGYTLQIGNGANIAACTGIPVVSDFRSADIALGGQGAPLVPVGDKLLFGDFHACLNLGGFANISFDWKGKRIAFDICPVNIILNLLAQELGTEYDKDGRMGEKCKANKELLEKLGNIGYYEKKTPKSLSREWMESEFLSCINDSRIPTENKLATVYVHIAQQIQKVITRYSTEKVLITGGGALNTYLMKLIQLESKAELVIPDKLIVEYKEAMVFAFLGMLRYRNQVNCLSSVTGAKRNSVCGVLTIP